MAIKDGRQWGATLDDIARNHVERYRFAAGWIRDHLLERTVRVLDVGCGCGYGTHLLASAGVETFGVDPYEPAIVFGRLHWAGAHIGFHCGTPAEVTGTFDLAVAFEVIEHVDNPLALMRAIRAVAPIVIASVPNEIRQPFSSTGHPDHKRHYTPDEFTALFDDAGFRVRERWNQASKEKYRVLPTPDGRTMIYVGRRIDSD